MLLLIIEPVKAAVVHLNADIVPVKADVVKYVYNISTENHYFFENIYIFLLDTIMEFVLSMCYRVFKNLGFEFKILNSNPKILDLNSNF